MRLFLVRHGQTVWNLKNRAQGHVDVGLDATGKAQADLMAQRLTDEGIQHIYTSDLTRCLETIQPLVDAIGIEPEKRADLRERTFGRMEGDDYSDLHAWMRQEAQRLAIPDWEVRPPGGESMADVWKRLDRIEEVLRQEARTVLVVSHGGALAQLVAKLIRGTAETPRVFRFGNCSVTTLGRRSDGSFLFECVNDCSHLEALLEASPIA